jgi:hypothetical protein
MCAVPQKKKNNVRAHNGISVTESKTKSNWFIWKLPKALGNSHYRDFVQGLRDQHLILSPIVLKLAPCLQADMPLSIHSSVTYYIRQVVQSLFETCGWRYPKESASQTFTSCLVGSSTSPQKYVLEVSPWYPWSKTWQYTSRYADSQITHIQKQ